MWQSTFLLVLCKSWCGSQVFKHKRDGARLIGLDKIPWNILILPMRSNAIALSTSLLVGYEFSWNGCVWSSANNTTPTWHLPPLKFRPWTIFLASFWDMSKVTSRDPDASITKTTSARAVHTVNQAIWPGHFVLGEKSLAHLHLRFMDIAGYVLVVYSSSRWRHCICLIR